MAQKILPPMLVSTADAVTESLREAILRGQFRPGERLLQERLAEDFGVSRQPVREALGRLETEGLVTSLLSGGCAVSEFSQEHVRENYRLRFLLEAEAASEAAVRMTTDEVDELSTVNARLGRAYESGDFSKVLELNRRFHGAIWLSSALPTLTSILDTLWATIAVAAPLLVPGRARQSVVEHDRIIRALQGRDARRAAELMGAHIRAAQADFERDR